MDGSAFHFKRSTGRFAGFGSLGLWVFGSLGIWTVRVISLMYTLYRYKHISWSYIMVIYVGVVESGDKSTWKAVSDTVDRRRCSSGC
jgi:hypothetical protein